jgi:hypothetical protein
MNIQPHYSKSTSAEKNEMLVVVGANIVVITFCLAYLVIAFRASNISWLYIAGAVLAGYFVADFASGIVHWGLDTWFSEETLGRAVAIAREHHTHPQNILGYGFMEHAALGSTPSAVFIGLTSVLTASFSVSIVTYSLMIVWTITAICLLFGTSFHNLGHKKSNSQFILALQKAKLINSPERHWVHHRNHVIRYCAVNGWANSVCDLFKIWRKLEWFVHATTGALPREDDLEWQRIFKETGVLATPASRRVCEALPGRSKA